MESLQSPANQLDKCGVILKCYQDHYYVMYRVVLNIIKDHYLTQDIIQEAFLKALKHQADIKDNKKVKAWMIKIAKRTAIDHLRKHKKLIHVSIDFVNGGEVPISVENQVEILRVIDELSSLREQDKEMLL